MGSARCEPACKSNSAAASTAAAQRTRWERSGIERRGPSDRFILYATLNMFSRNHSLSSTWTLRTILKKEETIKVFSICVCTFFSINRWFNRFFYKHTHTHTHPHCTYHVRAHTHTHTHTHIHTHTHTDRGTLGLVGHIGSDGSRAADRQVL
jgi:hypothetical protein